MPPRLRLAFLTLYPVETASTRQRIHKNVRFFPGDVESRIYPGITSRSLRRLEALGGGAAARLLFFIEEVGRKLVHIWKARRADVVVVQKGLTVMNVRGLTALLFALRKPVVFDFDDAVYLEPPQAFRLRALRPLLDRRQVLGLLRRVDRVVAGNRFLASVASGERGGGETHVIVTPMDTDWYRLQPVRRSKPLRVGWSGSTTTNHYVDRLAPALGRVATRVRGVEFRVISNDQRNIHWERFRGIATSFVEWRLDTLVEDLLELDVGLMPLADDEWSRSKCGGKILQYMACGIPTVASPVGINAEVIEDGVNGFLARDDEEWADRIATLLLDPDLRERMGRAARAKVEAEHSNRVTSPQLLEVIRSAALARSGDRRSLGALGPGAPEA